MMANEKRLIDAKPLMKNGWHLVKAGKSNIFLASMSLADVPQVDAVEVVRCKDCKHSTWDEEEAMWKCVYDAEFDERYGEYFGFAEYNNGEHFCSYGERREGE